ncbi:hypothetical protein DBR42_00340 [Pelomonas sp. HMWF004]|nr:hypothetical protein DBR42_00340 [Pelomonas sp. HMWF004]
MHRHRSPPHTDHRQAGQRILFGIGVMGVGVLALLDNLQLFSLPLLRNFWPLGLVLLGIARLAYPRHAGSWLFGTGLIVAGLLLTARNLGFADLDLRAWWPVLVIGAGLSIVLRGAFPQQGTGDGQGALVEPGDHVSIDAHFNTVRQRQDSRSFKGGRIDASFGGVALDLSQASMDGPEAVLQLSTRFSGIELRVPQGWQVVVEVQSTLGGVQDRSQPPASPAHRLVLRGETLCGGIEIKN